MIVTPAAILRHLRAGYRLVRISGTHGHWYLRREGFTAKVQVKAAVVEQMVREGRLKYQGADEAVRNDTSHNGE